MPALSWLAKEAHLDMSTAPKNDDFPNGSASIAWEKLSKVYKSNTMSDMVNLLHRQVVKVCPGGVQQPRHLVQWLSAYSRSPCQDKRAYFWWDSSGAHHHQLPEVYRPLVVGWSSCKQHMVLRKFRRKFRISGTNMFKGEGNSGTKKGGVALFGEAKFK